MNEERDNTFFDDEMDITLDSFFSKLVTPPSYLVLVWMLKYVSTSMVFISIILNGAVFIVFSSKEYRNNLDAMLRKFLAVSDALVVVLSDGLHTLAVQISGVSISTYNNITCKTIGTMHLFLRAFSAWILVLIALERFIGICFPLRAKEVNTKRNFLVLLLGIALVIVVLYSPLFDCLMYINVYHGRGSCTMNFSSEFTRWYGLVFYDWMNMLMTCGLPSFWIIVLNIAIICSLITSRRFIQGAANSRANMNSQVAILITVSFTFVVLSAPMAVYFFCMAFTEAGEQFYSVFGWLMMLGNFAPIFDSIHHSIYFIFYCLCGKKFRRCLMNQLRFICSRCRGSTDMS